MSGRTIKRLDELAQGMAPPRDLWPAIAAGIGARDDVIAQPRRSWLRPTAALAAALALVTLGVFIGRSIAPPAGRLNANIPVTNAGSVLTPAAFEHDAKYRKTRDALMVEVQSRLAAMPPADRVKIASSLATLRRSISEIEAALGRDPANALLQELLVNSCQEEMRALAAVRDSGSQEL